MKYITKNKVEADRLLEKVMDDIKNGRNVEYNVIKPQRTIRQNSYLHAIMGGYAAHYGGTMKEIKYGLIKKNLCRDIFFKGERVNMFGEIIEEFRSTSTLTTEETRDVIERFRNYAAMSGFYIPSPEEHKEAEIFRVYCLQQIDANKEFIYME